MAKGVLLLGILFLALLTAGGSFVYSQVLHTSSLLPSFHFSFFGSRAGTDELQQINFTGDVMLARHVESLLRDNGSDYPYTHLEKETGVAWVGNFEATVPKEHTQTKDFNTTFSVDRAHLRALKEAGFSHLSLANNHTDDFGVSGFKETKKHLRDFVAFGYPDTITDSSVTYITVDGVVVGLVGLNATTIEPDTHSLKQVLHVMQTQSDFQIAYIHWGEEYELAHNTFQETVARNLIDSGIDAVIGHHPHVVQNIGFIDGAPIFYSLGNFIFDQYFDESVQLGLVLSLTFVEDAAVFELMPVSTIESPAAPYMMDREARRNFLTDLSDRSAPELALSIVAGEIHVPR